jgi:IS30 family transposase
MPLPRRVFDLIWYNEHMTTPKEQIVALRMKGFTYSQIVKELGYSKGTIAYHLNEISRAKSLKRSNSDRYKKRQALQDIKEASGCIDCGEKYPYYILQFDHLPEYIKEDQLSKLVSRVNMDALLEEIKKCEVVCANCHAVRSHNRRASVSPDCPKVLEG